ncbi:MAG: hypothetical protein PVJ39_14110 [Gammaproteobacteria bacterium]|jgi:hypothetical protein
MAIYALKSLIVWRTCQQQRSQVIIAVYSATEQWLPAIKVTGEEQVVSD